LSFGAVRGRAVYKLELDDTGVRTKLQGFTSELQRSNFAIANLNKPMGSLNNNFQTMSGRLTDSVSPLSNVRKEMGALPTTFDKTNASIEKTGRGLKGIGEAFRGNKGLVFGFAGLASAAAEGIGMIGMWSDAVARQQEAQVELNEAVAKYGENSKQATDAQAEYQKQTRFAGMMTRNLVLSQMDQVFFGTMVISQLSQMNLKGGVLGKMIGGLKSGFDALKTSIIATNVASATGAVRLDALGASGVVTAGGMTTATAATNGFAGALGRVMLAAGPLLVVLAGAARIYQDFGKFSETMNQVVQGNTIQALKALRTQVQALTLVKFDDPLSWFNALNPARGVLKLSGVEEQLDKMIEGLENGSISLKDSGEKVADTWTDLTPKGAKLASSINDVSNATLGILPYTERMNELFKGTSAEVEVLAPEVDKLIDPVRELRMALEANGSTIPKVNSNFNHLFKTYQDGKLYADAFSDAWSNAKDVLPLVSSETETLGDSMIKTATATANEVNQIQSMITEIEGMDQAMVDGAASANRARAALEKAFDADIGSKVDKMLERFKKFADHDVDVFINVRAKKEALNQSVQTVIDGLTDFMTNDENADKVGEGLIDMINKSFKGKKKTQYAKDLIEYIEWAISQPNTDQLLNNLKNDIENGDPIEVPTQLKFDFSKLKNIKSDKGEGSGSSEIEKIFEGDDFNLELTATIGADSSEVEKAIQTVTDKVDDIASHNPVLNINNSSALDNVQEVKDKIDSIEDMSPSVTVHVGLSGPGVQYLAKGGIFSFAKGGIISASNGYTQESAGPQLVLMGDNPGGHETHAFIPHNNPEPIMNSLNAKFSGGDSGRTDLHFHLFDREIQMQYQRHNGRLMSRFGSRGSL
jgi:hypothetical protein